VEAKLKQNSRTFLPAEKRLPSEYHSSHMENLNGLRDTGPNSSKMDGYELESSPFFFNLGTYVSLYRGRARATKQPVVVKRHDFVLIQEKQTQASMVRTLNAALAQAKVHHPNSCDILEVQMEIEQTNCSIFHVLEALETDLEHDIEARRNTHTPYAERELVRMLQHTASALAYAHDKKIAHVDVKPGNIFRTADTYKLGDFGCFFRKQDVSMAKTPAGDSRYMSPQLREACMRGSLYNAFKTDVFALGASLLHMATLASPETLVSAERMQEVVGKQVEALSCSTGLKGLIVGMLAYEEGDRLTMQQVCATLATMAEFPINRELVEPREYPIERELVEPREYPIDRELVAPHDARLYVSHTPQNQPVLVKDFLCADKAAMACIREILVVAGVPHPNICGILSIFPLFDGARYRLKVVFEFLEKTLLQEIEERRARNPPGHYSEEELRSFLRKMASALQFTHSKSFANRNVNPEHIYITAEGEYKLSNFGQMPHVEGPFLFMCPKMKIAAAEGRKNVVAGCDMYKADVYSLGVMLIFMAKLFQPISLKSVFKHEANVEKLLADILEKGTISPQFLEIIRNMVRVEESDRFDSNNVLEALSQPNPQTTLFALTSTQLHTFDFPSDSWVTRALSGNSLSVNEHTATTALNTETLFCCGGGNRPCKFHTDKKAYIVAVSGVTQLEADMHVGRLRPGIVYYRDSASVFVFGGKDDLGYSIKTAIIYRFPKPDNFMAKKHPTGAWESLPDMAQPRFGFNPCLFADFIYISGGGHPSIEAYNPATCQPRPIPHNENVDPDISIMVVHMDKLVMIGRTRMFRWSHLEGRTVDERVRQTGPADWSNFTPVVVEDAVYTVVMTNQGFTLFKLGVITGKLMAERRFG